MSEYFYTKKEAEKAILVGVALQSENISYNMMCEYLDELAFLAETAGAETVKIFTQNLDKPVTATFVGKGKLEEIKTYVEDNDIDLIIFDDELSPTQIRNLERELKGRKVLDRTNLILDIFAKRARTAEAKAQVELAQYQYLLPRLTGMWTHLERQKGGIGLRGPGESEIETDRRIIRDKITRLKEQLAKIDKQMVTQRKNRGKLVRVALVGYTNVGKSTLTNKLVGQKVAIVSSKPQTTRTRITGVLSRGETQYVLLDTPGLHKPRSRLGDYMCKVVTDTVSEVDVAVLVVEPIPNIGPAEESLIAQIKQHHMPAILVINKIDTIKKEELLAVIATYAAVHEFDAVVPISARTGEGVEELLTEIDKYAIEGPQLFPEDMVSDQPERQLVAEIIREKLLRLLDREVPHGVAVGIERWNEREDGLVEINAVIYCEKASHKGIIIGKRGAMLKEIGQQARADIERMLDAKVFLELWVKVKEGWRNNQYQMRNFGYEDQ